MNYNVGATASDYDTTLLAWGAKVKTDLVRPTTWIRNEMAEDLFHTLMLGPLRELWTYKARILITTIVSCHIVNLW